MQRFPTPPRMPFLPHSNCPPGEERGPVFPLTVLLRAVWASVVLQFQQHRPSPGPTKPGPGPVWKFGIQRKSTKYKFSKSKSVSPKMSARSGLVGKNPPCPIWGHLGPFFAWAGQIKKIYFFAHFCNFTGLGPLLLSMGQARALPLTIYCLGGALPVFLFFLVWFPLAPTARISTQAQRG